MRYEEAASAATLVGWECNTCGRFSVSEHGARWCCASDLPCQCGGRNTDKLYSCCAECRRRNEADAWARLYETAVAWDGETPLYSESADRYFFDEDSLVDYCEEHEESPAALRLRLCTPNQPRSFDMNEFLSDCLPEDHELKADAINKTVNDWIAAQGVLSWCGDGPAVTVESLPVPLP